MWGCGGWAGVGGGGARAWPATGRVAQRSGPEPALATFPVQGRSCGLRPFAGGGGWCGAGLDACQTVGGGLQSEASLIDVRFDVGSLPTRSSSPTVAGCRLGGFSFLSDVIGGVESALWEGYPASTLALGVCVIVYV